MERLGKRTTLCRRVSVLESFSLRSLNLATYHFADEIRGTEM